MAPAGTMTMRTMILLALAPLALAACTTTKAPPSGRLSSYDSLTPRSGMQRAGVLERADDAALGQVRSVYIAPTTLSAGPGTAWMSPQEQAAVLREVDAQLCFELTERYQLAPTHEAADGRVQAVVTRVGRTGRGGSAVSAAAHFFIPGPIGVRPGGLGALSAEAEMLNRDSRQIAAITWNRDAQAVGMDNPSLSPIGDALQFAEPFADTAAAVMTAKDVKDGDAPSPDPCAGYGPRTRIEGWATKFATGLYVPEASGAKGSGETKKIDVPPAPPQEPVRITPPQSQ
jgi:hypothetical protein